MYLTTDSVHVGHSNTLANIFFDEGAQHSFITENLAMKLQFQFFTTKHIAVASFGANTLSNWQLPVAQVQVETQLRELLPISVLVALVIATPLHNTIRSCAMHLPYLQGLRLVHPVTGADNFQISTDRCWFLLVICKRWHHLWWWTHSTAVEVGLSTLWSNVTAIHYSDISKLSPDTNEPSLEALWSLEAIQSYKWYRSSIPPMLPAELYCKRSYTAMFPWKPDCPYLPTNFSISKQRTQSLITWLTETPNLLSVYNSISSWIK